MTRLVWLMTLAVLLTAGGAMAAVADGSRLVPVFDHQMLHFNPDSTDLHVEPPAVALDNGREVRTSVALPPFNADTRLLAHLTLTPTPKDELTVHDRWDRAGNVRLSGLDGPDIELVRFMTSYGGETRHTVDVTHLAPLLSGERSITAMVDTWVSPGWSVSLALECRPDTTAQAPDWVAPLYYTNSFNAEEMPQGVAVDISVPDGLARAVLVYTSTGHCTDGRDADEFVAKPNLISVDGLVVERLHPWRDDCRQYRERNPYTAKWTDGTWSSDFSRSGWCPGTAVAPHFIDLTDNLPGGEHTLRLEIRDMRPKDADGNFGYWRVSGYLIGWEEYPALWTN